MVISARICHNEIDDRVDRVLLFGSLARLGKISVAHAVFAENVSRLGRLAHKRALTTAIDRDLAGPPRHFQCEEGVLHLLLKSDIAVADRQRFDGDTRMPEREENRDDIVPGSIGIDNQSHKGPWCSQ